MCSTPGCPAIYPRSEGSRCPQHRAQADRARGSRQARGYDRTHDQLRQRWAPQVAAGLTACARCHKPITPTDTWALDHTDDRKGYLGPSHTHCNNSAGGKASHK